MNWIELTLNNYIIINFCLVLLYFVFNLNYRIRSAFSLSFTKPIKLLDCYPCLSFWLTLIVTGNPIFAMGIFLTSKIIDK